MIDGCKYANLESPTHQILNIPNATKFWKIQRERKLVITTLSFVGIFARPVRNDSIIVAEFLKNWQGIVQRFL